MSNSLNSGNGQNDAKTVVKKGLASIAGYKETINLWKFGISLNTRISLEAPIKLKTQHLITGGQQHLKVKLDIIVIKIHRVNVDRSVTLVITPLSLSDIDSYIQSPSDQGVPTSQSIRPVLKWLNHAKTYCNK